MKLSTASAILSQALPVVAETKLAAWFASEGGSVASRAGKPMTELSLTTPKSEVQRPRGLKSFSRVGGKKSSMNKKLTNEFPSLTDLKSCDPDSSDPDTGILSCGQGAICQPDEASFLGGFCAKGGKVEKLTNVKRNRSSRNKKNRGGNKKKLSDWKKLSKVECDPNEADLGLLGCPAGQTCTEMDGSSKGGFCTPPTSRNLQADSCKLCDGGSFIVPYTSDNTTITPLEGFGDSLTCGYLAYAAYFDQLPTGTTCDEASALAQSECGCTYYCDICGPGRFLDEATAEDLVSFPGYEAYTCSQVYYAGYTYYDFPGVSIPEGSCPALQETIGDACCVATPSYEECNICPGSQFIFPPDYGNAIVVDTPGYESITTCGELDYAVYGDDQTIASDSCPALSAIAAASCCSYQSAAEPCYVCPGSQFIYEVDYANAIVVDTAGYEGITTCGELESSVYGNQTIDSESCPALSAIAAAACCSYAISEPCLVCPGFQFIYSSDYENTIVVDTPGYEGISTCGELQNAVYGSQTIDSETCPALSIVATEYCCSYEECLVCPGAQFIFESDYGNPVAIDIPGYEGISTCEQLQSAAYFENRTIANETCPALSTVAEENCCSYYSIPYEDCDVCGNGFNIPYAFDSNAVTIPGSGNVTCYDVAVAAYNLNNSAAVTTTCSLLQDSATAACCRPYVVSCDVCGPDAEVPFDINGTFLDPTLGETSCYDVYYGSYVDGSIANETCSLVQASLAVSVCCASSGDRPIDAPMDPPTNLPAVIEATETPVASPVEVGGTQEPTAQPTEGSAASVAESRLMTMMAVGVSMFYALN